MNSRFFNKKNLLTLISFILIILVYFFVRSEAPADAAVSENSSIIQTADLSTSETTSALDSQLSSEEIYALDSQSTPKAAPGSDTLSSSDEASAPDPQLSSEATSAPEIRYSFRSKSQWKSHYEKHGIEMGFASKEDYLEAANRVILNPDSLHKQEKEDGDDVYYLEETNEFVIVSTDGYIRTYFYPSAGIDYYNRQ